MAERDPQPSAAWSVQPAVVAMSAASAVTALVLAVLLPDPAGRLLLGLAVVGLSAATVLGARLRPRLSADAHGVSVRGINGTLRLDWAEVDKVEVVRTRRLGREVRVLEISLHDSGHRTVALVVLTRLDLGADPQQVFERLLEVRMGPG